MISYTYILHIEKYVYIIYIYIYIIADGLASTESAEDRCTNESTQLLV